MARLGSSSSGASGGSSFSTSTSGRRGFRRPIAGGGGDEGDIGKGTFQLDVVGRLAVDADEVGDGDTHSVLAAVENYICKGGFPFGDLG